MKEKSYYECMMDIKEDELFEGLLGYGLFAEKLPPIFQSNDFFQYCIKYKDSLNINHSYRSDYMRFEIIRNNNIPRLLGIPDPFAYYNQCLCLKNNWTLLQQYFYGITRENNEFTNISRVHICKKKNTKKLFIMNYTSRNGIEGDIKSELFLASKYKVNVDINNFFSSIYTHAIPWALVGKKYAKNHTRDNVWFNQIDKYTRAMRFNETTGILTGPHSSNLLSEIILKNIDFSLSKKWKFIRHIDDYECFVPTEANAKIFILELTRELRKFGLSLNAKKTQIIELPSLQHPVWYRRLKLYRLLKQNQVWRQIDVISSFDVASEFEAETNDASVFNYLIKSLSNKEMEPSARRYFINITCHLAIIKPYLISLLDVYVFEGQKVNNERIQLMAETIYKTGIKTQNYEAVWYAIYFCIKYQCSISIDFEHELKSSSDGIYMLLAYIDAKRMKDQTSIEKHINFAKQLLQADNNRDNLGQYWLYLYEVLSLDDMPVECWKNMKRAGISFIRNEYRF